MHNTVKSKTHTLTLESTFIKKRKAPQILLNDTSRQKTGLKTCKKATYSNMHAWVGLHAHR